MDWRFASLLDTATRGNDMNIFPAFNSYVCDGDSVEGLHSGFRFVATIRHDGTTTLDDDDSHNTDTNVTGCNPEQQAKLIAAREAWARDEWFYCGVVLSVYVGETLLAHPAASLWGIEANYPGSDNAYLQEIANELAEEALPLAVRAAAALRAALDKVTK
jgi:hypothetical protein